MNYRELGKTGLRVSEIGLGCEGFVLRDDAFAEELFQLAFENGVNCMDLYTPNPDVQRRTGRAIRDRRGAFVLQAHLCAVWEDGQYRATRRIDEVRAAFETMLANLGTDYVDVGMIHYVDSPALWREIAEGPVMAYARELRRAGRIRHIGVSSHNPEAALAAVESGLVEVLMFSVNPCYDLQPPNEDVEQLWAPDNYSGGLTNMDPTRERLYETCQRMGVGITVMKAFGGGDLLSGELSPAGKALTPGPVPALRRHAPGGGLGHGRRAQPGRPARLPRLRDRLRRGAGLRRGVRLLPADPLGGPLHVLRTLRALSEGDRRGDGDQIPQPREGAGRRARDGAGALRRALP